VTGGCSSPRVGGLRIGIGLAALLVTAAAHAQPSAPERGDFQLGRFAIDGSGWVSIAHDPNITRETTSQAVGGWEVHTSPQLRARTDFGNFHVSTINALEVIKITGPSESQSDSDLSGQPWANVLSSVDVSRTGSRLSWKTGWLGKDTNARPTGFEVGARSRHTERAFTGSAEFNLSSRFSVTGRGSRTRVGYDADAIYNDSSLNETLDKTVVGGGGGVGIRITPLTGVFVTVDYLDETYHRAPELDNTGILTLGGFSFRTGAIVAGTIAMGYRTSTNGAGEHPLASPQTLVTLTHTRPSGASITATINRDSQQSYDINRGALTTFSTGLQGTLTPVKGWTGYWSFVHAALTYSVPGTGDDSHTEYIVGASHPFVYDTRLGVSVNGYSHGDPDSGAGYRGTRVAVFVAFGHGRWWKQLDLPLPRY